MFLLLCLSTVSFSFMNQIQFEGVQCAEPSVGYHVGFASVFLLVAATSLIQLFICIHAEYARLKTPSFLKACRITNQKFLYILVFLAALLRGLYFAYPVNCLNRAILFTFHVVKC